MQSGQADDTPAALKARPWLSALYDNLPWGVIMPPVPENTAQEPAAKFATAADSRLELALAIDDAVRRVRPDDWRGHQARENEIKRALLPLLHNDVREVERVFLIVKAQNEY